MNFLGKTYCAARDLVRPAELTPRRKMERDFLDRLEKNELPSSSVLVEQTLKFASENIPFYQNLANTHSLKGAPLRKWPPLTKKMIRDNFEDLKDPSLEKREHWLHASGGSTGQAICVVHDEMFAARAEATRKFAAKIFYGGPYMNQIILWGSYNDINKKTPDEGREGFVKSWIKKKFGLKTSLYNTFHFTPEEMAACARAVNDQKPDLIMGYTASVYWLAKYMDQHEIEVVRKPRVVVLTAQTCYPFMREMIEKVFKCHVCDHYGSREVGPVVWQAEDGNYCICDKFDFIEIVDDADQPVEPGGEGRVLVTTLHNYAMPLIRYDIGDRAVAGETVIVNGYEFPTLRKLTGRISEDFVGPSGSFVSGLAFVKIFCFRDWVDEFQVIQRERNFVEIYFTRVGVIDCRDVEEIDSEIYKLLGNDCKILWSEVDKIPKTKAGKHLYVRCLVDQEKDRQREYAAP